MVRINIGGKVIEQVKEFCCLGSEITTDAKCHREIRRRIAIGKEAFSKRRELLRGKVNRTLKIHMIKTLIWSVVLYGAETWTMRKEDIKRLEAFEMWTWRRMKKVSWTEHKTNEEILETVGEERSLIRRGVYPYTRVAQMRHLRNWGERLFGSLGGRTKNIDVLMIVMLKLANGFSDYEQVPRREILNLSALSLVPVPFI